MCAAARANGCPARCGPLGQNTAIDRDGPGRSGVGGNGQAAGAAEVQCAKVVQRQDAAAAAADLDAGGAQIDRGVARCPANDHGARGTNRGADSQAARSVKVDRAQAGNRKDAGAAVANGHTRRRQADQGGRCGAPDRHGAERSGVPADRKATGAAHTDCAAVGHDQRAA